MRTIETGAASHPISMRPGVSDWIAFERIFLDREYDCSSDVHNAALDRLEASIARRGRTPLIIDCGANIGLASIWFADRFSRATIIAVEPESRNFDVLCANAARFPNIVPFRAAVSDSPSRVNLVSGHGEVPWAWQTTSAIGHDGDVIGLTIADLLARYQKNHDVMLVKMDIEGFETIALAGDTAWIDDLPVMVFEMHDWLLPWSGSGHAFFSLLARRRRDYLIKGENVFAFAQDLRHSA